MVAVVMVSVVVVGQSQRQPPCNPQPSLRPGDPGDYVDPPLTNCLLLHFVCVCVPLCLCLCVCLMTQVPGQGPALLLCRLL